MRTVLVLDGEQRAALAVVRSLGIAGYRVLVASASGRSLSGASRHAAAEYAVPDPLADARGYGRAVRLLSESQGVGVLCPITEPSLLALLPLRDRFAALLPFADAHVFARACDKLAVTSAAAGAGIRVPRQVVLQNDADAHAMSPQDLSYPVVLKPARSVAGDERTRVRTAVVHVQDADEWGRALGMLAPEAYPVLVQERIVGPGTGIFVLLWNGELRAAFAHRRLREKPPSGGVSVLRESIPLDHDLLNRSVTLLRSLEFNGVAMVEYKQCARTGTPYLMEINGRFWGSLQLAIDAGVDFPALLIDAAQGRPRPRVLTYRTGVRSRWEWGEVDHLLARTIHSAASLNLPDDAPGRFRALAGVLYGIVAPHTRAEIFRWSDPRPFLRESRTWLRDLLPSRGRKVVRSAARAPATVEEQPVS